MITTLLASLALNSVNITLTLGWGFQHCVFAVGASKVHVFLPDDLRAGDTITGTVVMEPSQPDPKKPVPSDSIEGVVVEFQGKPITSGRFVAMVGGAGLTSLALKSQDGESLGQTPLQVGRAAPPTPNLWVAPVSQAGKPVQITGPFDGNASNTSVSMGGHPCTVLTESPRSIVTQPTPGPTGTTSVTVNEAGNAMSGATNLVEFRMSAPKKQLLRGERATVSLSLSGLQGVPESAYPLPLEITNHTPMIVQLDRAHGGQVCLPIQFADVKDGAWHGSLTMTGITPGTFLIGGVFFSVSIHVLKMGLDAEELGALIDANIASTEALLEKKRAEKIGDWGLNLIIKKLKSLNDAKDALPDIDSARVTYDVAQASFSVFQMAGELIDLAADLLGYKDIPMPGLGAALKGLKVAAKGSAKAVELIEKIEKVKEEIDKITDAAEKAKKAKEAKDLLDKVRDELKGKK